MMSWGTAYRPTEWMFSSASRSREQQITSMVVDIPPMIHDPVVIITDRGSVQHSYVLWEGNLTLTVPLWMCSQTGCVEYT